MIKNISSKCQRGAVMVYVAGMAALLAMMVLFVYNTGYIANEKTRLQNTTDAAAHSVAVLQSRDLNFSSYMNRSMVANQVAVAQIVSLVSWMRFLEDAIAKLRKYTGWVPYWGAVINYIANVAAQVKPAVERGAGFAVTAQNQLIEALSRAQKGVHDAVVLEIPLTMREVVKANDPGVSDGLITNSALMAQLVASHRTSIEQYSPDNVKNRSGSNWQEDRARADEFRDVTLASRDGFSTSRTYDLLKINLGVVQTKLVRAGGSELVSSNSNAPYYTWAAMDTFSEHNRKRKLTGWSSWKEKPLAWGAAQTGDSVHYERFRGNSFGHTWSKNKISSGLDAREYSGGSKTGSFSGLRKFTDIAKKGLLDRLPAPIVLLTKPQAGDAVRTARETGFVQAGASIDVEQPGGMLNNQLHAVAKAEAYFSRPDDLWRRPRGREYGNLYNPFWQPRLAQLTPQERIAALGLAGMSGI
jgi:Flp pilus assembly protein TadG